MIDFLKHYHIILGSQSPRRKELLRGMDIDFEVLIQNTKEDYPETLPTTEVPEYLACKKATAYNFSQLPENTLLITSDTIVLLNDEILGKPQDEEDARKILSKLSGNMHTVLSGVCLKTNKKQHSFTATSHVFFRQLEDIEIDHYVTHYKPLDKAGAYGIQEWIGYIGIERIEGSYFNVMGLPTQKLFVEMKKFLEKI